LFRNVDIGDEIPATLYIAIAQILTYVFQLKVAKGAGQQPPPKPDVSVKE
jgi:flagellar biosynthetic protein FlhB